MSIATQRGDTGQTGLAGGIRVSKAHLRVETYGTVDELNTHLGFARSLCPNTEIATWTETIQRTLFRLGSALATPPNSKKTPPVISSEDVAFLTELLAQLEKPTASATASPASAAYTVARTICRRAERAVHRFVETGETVQPTIPAYLQHLAELLDRFTATA